MRFWNREFTALNRKTNKNPKIKHFDLKCFFFYPVILNQVIILKLKEFIVTFGFGGIIYGMVEVLTRGYTHWTMVLTGGAVFTAIYLINLKMTSESIIPRCFVGCIIITAAEFTVGCIVNLALKMNVWDYSAEKFNVLGQICPLFSCGWFLICIPATLLAFSLRRQFKRNS